MNQHGVVLFHTSTAALRAEKILKQAGFEVKLVPVPRELSSDCGISLRFNWVDRVMVEAGLRDAIIEYEVHPLASNK
jgi:hypothetical protein